LAMARAREFGDLDIAGCGDKSLEAVKVTA